MCGRWLVWIATLAAFPHLTFAQRFGMMIPAYGDVEMARGGVIRIGGERPVKRLLFRIGTPVSTRITAGKVSVEIDRQAAELTENRQGGILTLTADVQEAADWFASGKLHQVRVSVLGGPEYSNQWTVERTESPLMTETAGDDEGVPVEIKLSQPVLPLLLSPRQKTFKVSAVVNRTDARVLINGKAPAATKPSGSLNVEVSDEIEAAGFGGQLVIEATGTKQDYCRMVILGAKAR
jgi:hypothetical protein